MKKLHSNASFEKMLANYKEKPSVDTMEKVFNAFWRLASNILDFVKFPGLEKAFKNKSRTIRRLVFLCFIKLPKFDPKGAKAFNFFTTIILCWLRQEYRESTKYAELKAKYAEAIKT